MIVVNEDDRAIAEGLSSKGIDNRHHPSVVDVLPLLDSANRSSVAQTESWKMSVTMNAAALWVHTF